MTTRGVEGNAAMDPNVNNAMKDKTLSRVPFDDSWMGANTHEAWSNIRMGAGYDYPTHIDCFENVLVQLAGRKRVKLYHPDSVAAWQPVLNHKHWPGTSEAERTEDPALREVLESTRMSEVILEPGDALYIPSMYFHSVHVEEDSEWSVSANRYYYSGDGGRWLETNHARKSLGFLAYEEQVQGGGSVC